jgi:hypothetical protein
MAAAENHLIEMLPRLDRRRLLAVCERVDLTLSQVVSEAGKRTRHVYFPTGATISLVTPIDGKPVLEVGMVGSEGMVGAQLILGVTTTTLHCVVQASGPSWRISSPEFLSELERSAALRRCLNRYLFVLMSQFAVSAACLRFHLIGPRLARWLLMTQDRVHADSFHVTHEFLGYMLGVRRVGITAAAGALQRGGLIAYRRGELVVLDRAGLEAAACGCYAEALKFYAKWLN